MEVTKWLKSSISVSRICDSASVQAVTRVNAEQSSKRTMRRPTRLPFRGRLIRRVNERSYAQTLRRGIGGSMYTRKAHETREAHGSKTLSPTRRDPPGRRSNTSLRWWNASSSGRCATRTRRSSSIERLMRSDGYLRLHWILVLLCSDHKFARAAFECL